MQYAGSFPWLCYLPAPGNCCYLGGAGGFSNGKGMDNPHGPATCTAGRAHGPEYFGSLPIKASPKVHTCTLSHCFPEIFCLVGIFLKCTLLLSCLILQKDANNFVTSLPWKVSGMFNKLSCGSLFMCPKSRLGSPPQSAGLYIKYN